MGDTDNEPIWIARRSARAAYILTRPGRGADRHGGRSAVWDGQAAVGAELCASAGGNALALAIAQTVALWLVRWLVH